MGNRRSYDFAALRNAFAIPRKGIQFPDYFLVSDWFFLCYTKK